MGIYKVYQHTTPSGKVYFGLTSMDMSGRLRGGYSKNIFFQRAIEKYGWKNIDTKIIADNLSKDEAALLETWCIASYGTQDRANGYNIESGGFRGRHNELTRAKISEKAKLRHRPQTAETKEKLSKAAHKRAVRCVETGEEYESVTQAARYIGVTYRDVRRVLAGERRSVKGTTWQYVL